MNLEALLAATVGQLERANVPYMVTGAVASSFYGEPRATRDLDIVIDPDRPGITRLITELKAAGMYVQPDAALRAFEDRTPFNAIDRSTGWKVDFLIRRDRDFSREEFGRRTRANLLGTSAWIASPEDMIVAKVEWSAAHGSERQLEDVAAMLDIGLASLDLEYVDRWIDRLGLHEPWKRAQALRSAG